MQRFPHPVLPLVLLPLAPLLWGCPGEAGLEQRGAGLSLLVEGGAPGRDLALADWDRDGTLELALARGPDAPVEMYENEDGDLFPVWSSPELEDGRAVAFADWDFDSDLDLAVGNGGGVGTGEPNRVYYNAGGTLVMVWETEETDNTHALAWGEYSLDDRPDLAVGNYGEPNRLYTYGGDEGMTLHHSFELADATTALGWADFDGDGLLDLAVANEGEPDAIYRGGSWEEIWSSPESAASRALAIADLDGDQDPDLVVAGEGEPLRVYRNDGGAVLSLDWSSDSSLGARAVAIGDPDGDGLLDLIASGDAVWLYRGDGGSWSEAGSHPEALDALVLGDWQRSGLRQILGVGDDGVTVLEEEALFPEGNGLAPGQWTAAAAIDLDGAGQLELVSVGLEEPLTVWVPEPTGGYRAEASGEGFDGAALALGDADRDGDIDVAVAGNSGLELFLADGGQLSSSWLAEEGEQAADVAWGDFDRDGWLDLATAGVAAPVRVYRNRGDGSFELYWESDALLDHYGVAWAQATGDSRLDLAVASDGPAIIYTPDGDGFTERWRSPEERAWRAVLWLDLTDDNQPELILGSDDGPSLTVFRNAESEFEPFLTDGTLPSIWSLAELDWTGDGRADVAASGPGGSALWAGVSQSLSFHSSGPAAGARLSVADLDADSDPDLLLAGDSGLSGLPSPLVDRRLVNSETGLLLSVGGGPGRPHSPGMAVVDANGLAELPLGFTAVDPDGDLLASVWWEIRRGWGANWEPAGVAGPEIDLATSGAGVDYEASWQFDPEDGLVGPLQIRAVVISQAVHRGGEDLAPGRTYESPRFLLLRDTEPGDDDDDDDVGDDDDDTILEGDEDRDGWLPPLDCDDSNPDVHPAAWERCDGVDEDCDGFVDDGLFCGELPGPDDPEPSCGGCAQTTAGAQNRRGGPMAPLAWLLLAVAYAKRRGSSTD